MNWERVRLGDVCKIDNGYAFKSKNYVSDKGARIIRITNVQKGKVVDNDPKLYPFEMLAGLERYEIFENDIMMSLTGNVGRVGRFPKEMLPAYINQRVCRIKSIDKKLDETYLFHFLNSDIFEREAIYASAGIAQLNLSTNWVADYIIPLPPMSVQKEIVEKLDKAAAIREKSKALLSHYDALAESLFIELFGDPISNEKGWEKKKLGEVGLSISNIKNDFTKDEIYYIDIGSIDNEINEVVSVTKYPLDERPSRAQQILNKGDVLFSTVRPNLRNIAINQEDDLIGSTGFYVIRAGENIENKFLFRLLLSDSITKDFESMVSGANYPSLRKTDLDDYEIIIPPLSLQIKFAEMVENIERQKARAKAEIEQGEAVFQALLQESFG